MNEDVLKALVNYGGLVVLSALFIFDWIDSKKSYKSEKENNTKVLDELAKSNNNIAQSLNLLKASMDNTNNEFKQHDERAIREFSDIKQTLSRKK